MRQCCTDRAGNPKKKYQSKEEAEKSAQRRNNEGVKVIVYRCEEGDGWHLTSQNASPPERLNNVMIQVERVRYTKKNKNLLGNILDEELVNQLKNESQKNTLSILGEKIELAQQELDQKTIAYKSHKKDFFEVRKILNFAKQDLDEAQRELRNAQHEYDAAKGA